MLLRCVVGQEGKPLAHQAPGLMRKGPCLLSHPRMTGGTGPFGLLLQELLTWLLHRQSLVVTHLRRFLLRRSFSEQGIVMLFGAVSSLAGCRLVVSRVINGHLWRCFQRDLIGFYVAKPQAAR